MDLILPYTGRSDIKYTLQGASALTPTNWVDLARKPKQGSWENLSAPGSITFHEGAGDMTIRINDITPITAFWRMLFTSE